MSHTDKCVAVAQIEPSYLDPQKTIKKMISYILAAGSKGAKLIVFPELVIAGYPNWINLNNPREQKTSYSHWQKYLAASLSIDNPYLASLMDAAKKNNITIVFGLSEKDSLHNNVIYNSSIIINSFGELLGTHRKLTPVKNELLFFRKGDKADIKIFHTSIGKIGIGICAEHFNPLYRHSLGVLGEEIHCALWVNHSKLRHAVDASARITSIENGVFTLVSCQVTTEHSKEEKCEIDFIGGSGIISPWGEYLVGPVYNEETVLYANIDNNLSTNTSATYSTFGRDNLDHLLQLKF